MGDRIRHCVGSLCAGAPPSRRLDERVTRVLAAIQAADDLRVSIEATAARAFLSPSRFAHLFKQQVGLPFRREMLWRKLTRAMLAIGKNGRLPRRLTRPSSPTPPTSLGPSTRCSGYPLPS